MNNRVIFQQNIILQFSVKLVCQSVIALCLLSKKNLYGNHVICGSFIFLSQKFIMQLLNS